MLSAKRRYGESMVGLHSAALKKVTSRLSMKESSQSDSVIPAVRKPKRERTRERICIAAREVFLSVGFGAATVEQIALAAGTQRSTLYNHFRDKNEILAAIGEDYLEAVSEVIRQLAPHPTRAEIDAWIRDFAEFALRQRAPTLLVVHFSAAIDMPDATRQFGAKLMQLYGNQLPAFRHALKPKEKLAFAKAVVVLRELSWALCYYVEHEGRELSPQMLEVAADLFERFVGNRL
jgi:AcrR family transcriptional regulator